MIKKKERMKYLTVEEKRENANSEIPVTLSYIQ